MESAGSIRLLYRHFLSRITEKSLNAFYYACSYAKADYSSFMNTTAALALGMVPERLRLQPVFPCIDDTMVPKFGRKFEDISKLFDHAAHNGSSYLNGHCFVSLMLLVPVWRSRKVSYLEVPLGYRMWNKKESKLSLAANMVRQVMPVLHSEREVVMLCDSWYAKRDIIALLEEFPNLDIICNARTDSVVYGLAPERTGKKGRPAKHGARLSIQDDFRFSEEKIGGYYTAVRRVLTNLFGSWEVLAYVTATDRGSGSRRLFFSTVFPTQLQICYAWQEDELLRHTGSSWMQYIPLFLYPFRWPIETSYYEQKSFWSLCSYMVRSSKGIEMPVNLINISYCAMKLLPYSDSFFTKYQGQSVQDFRFSLSEQIREQIFIASFARSLENTIKS
ncbi:MAG: transposase, partial [Lachnospiraceae bacterium]|nr:transposase [Lachnospiraceae bacterium]